MMGCCCLLITYIIYRGSRGHVNSLRTATRQHFFWRHQERNVALVIALGDLAARFEEAKGPLCNRIQSRT
jgi:hypothetical protein